MTRELKVGDLIWAKMRTFPPWPARIVEPGPSAYNFKKPSKSGPQHWVYFFGSRNYAWVEENSIMMPYDAYKEEYLAKYTTSAFKKAVVEMEEFVAKLQEDPNYELDLPPEGGDSGVNENDEKFNKLLSSTPKKPKKTPIKRVSSESSSRSRNSLPKRARSSPIDTNENGIADVGTTILNLPTVIDAPVSIKVDLKNRSELVETKNIPASKLKFGFIGLGNMGTSIVKNLINSGHTVNLYCRTGKISGAIKEQADEIKPDLVNVCDTPNEIMQASDIVFSCVTDAYNAKQVVIGNCGIVGREEDTLEGKGYVEMTSIDPQTSKDICEIIKSKGGRYLEAQIQGSKTEAEDGTLVILTAGDEPLFRDCQSCFKAMGKTAFYLGDTGYACKTNLILQLMKGVALVGLAEGLALADRCGISSKDVLNIFKLTNLNCSYLTNKAEMIVNQDFKHVEQAVEHMQKDMKMTLDLSNELRQPLLMTSTANEVYKRARRLGYDGQDASCIYMRTRH